MSELLFKFSYPLVGQLGRLWTVQPRNTNWSGRLSTIDLLIKVACFEPKIKIIFNTKRSWSKLGSTRSPTVLSLPFQADFPDPSMSGNAKGGSITVPLTSCLTSLESAVWLLTIFGFYLKYRLIQTSQTGGQWYSGPSVFPVYVFYSY